LEGMKGELTLPPPHLQVKSSQVSKKSKETLNIVALCCSLRHRAQSECENIWTASKADVSSRYATAGKRMTTLPSHLFGGILGSVLESRNWLVCSQRSRVLRADSGRAVVFFAGCSAWWGLISRFKNLWRAVAVRIRMRLKFH